MLNRIEYSECIVYRGTMKDIQGYVRPLNDIQVVSIFFSTIPI